MRNTSTPLAVKNNESTIDALARHNHTIKSLFHFDKPITFLVILLAIQKVKNTTYHNGIVVISRGEIQALARGNDLKIGIEKLIKKIKQDIKSHNFFNKYSPNSGLKNVETTLVKEIAETNDMHEDLYIKFRNSLFKTFKIESNYTIQSLKQIRACGENQRTILYTLTQPYAKSQKPLKLLVSEIRRYLRIADDQYSQTCLLTNQIKRLCQKITAINDINLQYTVIKVGKKTNGYIFQSKFKHAKKIQQIGHTQTDKTIEIKTTIKQQLTNWGVGKNQIDIWLYAFDKETLEAAINQTINRNIKPNSNNNSGGYIYRILGDGKQQAREKNTNNNPKDTLRQFGLSPAEVKAAKDKLGVVLSAVANQCLREKDKIGSANLRQHFNQLVDKYHNELKNNKTA